MVDIAGFSVGAGALSSFVSTLVWGIIIITILAVVGLSIKNKMAYKYEAIVVKRRDDNLASVQDQGIVYRGKAGYFPVKGSNKVEFRIKYGPMPNQVIKLSKTPDPKYMVGNLVLYMQIQKDNLVQAQMKPDWTYGNVEIMAVEDDVKFGSQLDMMEIDNVLKVNNVKPVTVGLAIMGIILVTGIIVFYFLRGG